MKKMLFIINPQAGVDRVKALKKAIDKHLNHSKFNYEITYTQHAKHGTELAKEAAQKGVDIVVAVGGDGSVNDVVNGLYGTETTLAIIPKGSGNGLARSLKIPMKEVKAIQALNNAMETRIDVGSADGHLFVSNAGVGFDTVITEQFRNSKRRGLAVYLNLILKNLWRYPVREWQISIDGKTEKTKAFMFTVANAIQLGYGFQVAPKAKLNDETFDVVTIRQFPKALASTIALQAFTGRINKNRFVKIQQGKEIIIRHPELNTLQIDGEAVPCKNEILIKMMPQSLKILSPSLL